MSTIFGFLLIIIVIVLVIGFSIISGILRLLFGFGRRRRFYTTDETGTRRNASSANGSPQDASGHSEQASKKKIFGEDEGEYVDFEEVKDNLKK